MTPRLIVDTDLKGLNDDAFALHYLLQVGVHIDHVSTVFGNTSARRSTADVLELRDLYPGAAFPVETGHEQPLGWPEQRDGYRRLLSTLPTSTYLAGLGLDQPLLAGQPVGTAPAAPIPPQPAGSQVTVLALGPLTNVAAALTARVFDACSHVDVVACAGGIERGNVTEHAEFNAFADPAALALVLSDKRVAVALVPLEVSEVFGYDREQYELISRSPSPFGRLLGPAKRDLFAAEPAARDQAWDLTAALLLQHPELAVDTFDAPIDVAPAGSAHPGQTRRADGPSQRPRVHVVTAIDHDRARGLFAGAFS